MKLLLLTFICTLLTGASPIFLKKSTKDGIRKAIWNYNLYLGLGLYGLSYVIFIPVLREGDLSLYYPLLSLSYIWVALLSMKFLKENMKTINWIGIFLIILGITILSFSL